MASVAGQIATSLPIQGMLPLPTELCTQPSLPPLPATRPLTPSPQIEMSIDLPVPTPATLAQRWTVLGRVQVWAYAPTSVEHLSSLL